MKCLSAAQKMWSFHGSLRASAPDVLIWTLVYNFVSRVWPSGGGGGLGKQIPLHKGAEEGLLLPAGYPGCIHLSSHRCFKGEGSLNVVLEGVSGLPHGSWTPTWVPGKGPPHEQKANPSEQVLMFWVKKSQWDQCDGTWAISQGVTELALLHRLL